MYKGKECQTSYYNFKVIYFLWLQENDSAEGKLNGSPAKDDVPE